MPAHTLRRSPRPRSLRRRGVAAVLGVLWALAAGPSGALDPVPDGVDHRAAVDAAVYPWSSVAKLFNSVGGACTGAVIGRDSVLTAAHCVYAFRTRRFLPPEAIHVLIGYVHGDYRVHAQVRAYRIGSGYDPQAERQTAAADWALLDLTEPLPDDVAPLRVAASRAPDALAIMVGGFARDRAFQMTADENCRITGSADGGRLIAHDCFVAPGDSGAPLLLRPSLQEAEVAGVAVGIWRIDGKTEAIAAPVSPAILAQGVVPP